MEEEREGKGGMGVREREKGGKRNSYQFLALHVSIRSPSSHLTLSPPTLPPSHPLTLSPPHSLTFSNSTSTIVPPFIFRISTGVVFGLGCGLGFIKSVDNPELSTDKRDMLN